MTDKEIQKWRERQRQKVCVYDFNGSMLGECRNAQEASRVFETPLTKVNASIESGAVYGGLQFQRKIK